MGNPVIRTEVWNQMVKTDRLRRYYGVLADRIVKRDRRVAALTTALAMSTLVGTLLPSADGLTWILALATIVSSLWPLVYRSGGKLTRTAQCHARLSYLHQQFRSLWIEIESGSVGDDVATKLGDLAGQIVETTIPMAETGDYDEELSDRIEEQVLGYWKAEAEKGLSSAATAT